MLRDIKEEWDLSRADLQKELGLDARTIDKLLKDDDIDQWRLDRSKLHQLVLFAHAHGYELFRVVPHPIWRSFEGKEVAIFRGSGKADAPVEDHLTKHFERLHAQTHSSTVPDGIEEAMKTKNCVVIGSPKANRASEIALSLLWGAEPFGKEEANRDRIPVHFLGMTDQGGPSAILQQSSRHGLNVRIPNSKARKYIKVDWLPAERYGAYKGDGQDAAVLVACYQPLGTTEDVTTIVIAGYTGLSTLVAAQEATSKRIPEIQPEETPGEPCFATLKFTYRKRSQKRKSVDNLRSHVEPSYWGPPWDNGFFP